MKDDILRLIEEVKYEDNKIQFLVEEARCRISFLFDDMRDWCDEGGNHRIGDVLDKASIMMWPGGVGCSSVWNTSSAADAAVAYTPNHYFGLPMEK